MKELRLLSTRPTMVVFGITDGQAIALRARSRCLTGLSHLKSIVPGLLYRRRNVHQTEREGCMWSKRRHTWSRMDEMPQSGILEGEQEMESVETVHTGCLDWVRLNSITALAPYSTEYLMRMPINNKENTWDSAYLTSSVRPLLWSLAQNKLFTQSELSWIVKASWKKFSGHIVIVITEWSKILFQDI